MSDPALHQLNRSRKAMPLCDLSSPTSDLPFRPDAGICTHTLTHTLTSMLREDDRGLSNNCPGGTKTFYRRRIWTGDIFYGDLAGLVESGLEIVLRQFLATMSFWCSVPLFKINFSSQVRES